MIRWIVLGLLAAAAPAAAQIVETEERRVSSAGGAVLRALDKVAGAVEDVEMSVGETRQFGRLDLTLGDCRYPGDNPSGDAYAYLTVRETGEDVTAFEGWMIASAPALNALEHPRYDVWVMRCRI
ncbi:DUF2155 domain-containing protein [Rhodobacteraceae bacterium CCMM004]|nr:DUF2155 domain-containing protein [Rhodobacteraceae bacterium CCMM004]